MLAVVGTSDLAVLSYPDFLLSLTWVLAPSRLAHKGTVRPSYGRNPALRFTWYDLPGSQDRNRGNKGRQLRTDGR